MKILSKNFYLKIEKEKEEKSKEDEQRDDE